jgi:hypothetical protein
MAVWKEQLRLLSFGNEYENEDMDGAAKQKLQAHWYEGIR